MTRDFTLEKYAQLCEVIRAVGCPVMTVKRFLQADQPQKPVVVLRHDVDRQVDTAMRMAKLESKYGIAATYYVRTTPRVFKPQALKRLHELGHEVGYHYEALARAKGNTAKAIQTFEQELNRFRDLVPVDTISMHGSPLSPWNNLDLWHANDLQDYGILGDAVLSLHSEHLYYFTDTGRSWDADRYNLRDRMASGELRRQVRTTDDLIGFLQEGSGCPVYISAHPNRWASNWLEWTFGVASDWIINRGKMALSMTRSCEG